MTIHTHLPVLFAAVFVLAACALPISQGREASLLATIDALSAKNAELAGRLTRTAPPVSEPDTVATPAPPTPVSGGASSRLPRLIAARQLAAEGQTLRDFRRDVAANRLYVTDSQFRLYVLDAATYELLQTEQTTGDMLMLDEVNGRLYIMPSYEVYFSGPAFISIFDTGAQSLSERILAGSRVSLDSVRNHLYVGDLYTYSPGPPRAPLRLLDGATFEELARSERVGTPLYNPASDDLILTAYSAYTLDPLTLVVRADLFPDISGQEIPGCNGCEAIRAAYLFVNDDLIAFERMIISAGKGPGLYPQPYFKQASSLASVEPTARFAATCSSQPLLREPWRERIYDHLIYSRYVTFNNLVVRDLAGVQLTLRDGLDKPFVNPGAEAAYIFDAFAGTFVLDLESLLPMAYIQPLCLIERAPEAGLLFAFGEGGRSLLVLEEVGGSTEQPPPQPADLAGSAIRAIYVSPDYAQDQTIFLDVGERLSNYTTASALYRTTDSGASWMRLRGWLPAGVDLTYSVALSPDFGDDRTLLVGGFRREATGIGVWRSTDAGDAWQPGWQGLDHLRITQLGLSPNFAHDGLAVAYARYQQIEPWDGGAALYQSSDGGQSWTLKAIASDPNMPPPLSTLLPGGAAPLPVRKQSYSDPIEYTTDGGISWESAVANAGANTFLIAFLAPPDWPESAALYAVLETDLLRSLDGGRTWQRWQDARLENRTYDNYLSAAAVSPLLTDSGYRLLIGTLAGEFWQLDPQQMAWTPLARGVPLAAAAPLSFSAPATGGLTGEPPLGFHRPQGSFSKQWENDPALQEALGWARSTGPIQTAAAIQPFEHGLMVWRGDTGTIYALFDDLTWEAFGDSFVEGDPESDPALTAPEGLLQPTRGFGKVWRNFSTVQKKLGWGVSVEQGTTAALHEFERGVILYCEGQLFILSESPSGRVWR